MTEHGIGRIKDDFAGTSRFDRLIHGLWRLVEGKPHGAPDQGDDAFGNHGAVENGTALAFRFDAARHHRGLGGVESADGSTGNGDEKHGPDGKAGRVRSEGDGALRDDLGAAEEKSSEHGSRHQDQADGEKRVDAPDEGIDRQDGGGKVVKEDKSGPYGHAHAGHVGQELGRAGGKDDADQDDEDDAEVADDLPGGVAQVLADQFRKAHASVPQGHHTGKIVVDGSAQDTPKVIQSMATGPYRAPRMAPYTGPSPAMFRSWIKKIFHAGNTMKSTPSGEATAGVSLLSLGRKTRSINFPYVKYPVMSRAKQSRK